VVVERSDVQRASVTYLRTNEVVTVDDLLHLLLIASDNAAARVIARISPWGSKVHHPHEREGARTGLASTRYADPSGCRRQRCIGLRPGTADRLRGRDERISSLMRKADHEVVTSRRRVTIHNTNQLVKRTDMDVRGGKTGFISSSGYCLATCSACLRSTRRWPWSCWRQVEHRAFQRDAQSVQLAVHQDPGPVRPQRAESRSDLRSTQ